LSGILRARVRDRILDALSKNKESSAAGCNTTARVNRTKDRTPERVVCLDVGFHGNDQLKANAVQILQTKGIPSFKTA
jgi:hypothetical protein